MPSLQTVLCALDGDQDSYAAAIRAADLAEREHAALHIVHVDPVPRTTVQSGPDSPLDRALTQRLEVAVDEALGADGAFDLLGPTVHVVHGQAASDAIVGLAREIGADMIVMGTHAEHGLARALIGSTASETVRSSPVPVLVVPEHAEHGPGPNHPVLVAVDFSDLTVPALDHAVALAERFGASVEAVHVLEGGPEAPLNLGGLLTLGDLHAGPDGDVRVRAARALRQLAHDAGLDAAAAHVSTGAPETAITRLAAERRAGAIVLGTHGRTGWDRIRLGSVAEWIVRHASCPVLAVPAARVSTTA